MKRLLVSLLVVIAAVSMVFAGCSGDSEESLRIATDATWPPFEYIDTDSGEIVGFDIDLFNAVADEADLDIEFVNVEWDPLLAGVAQGTYDAAISSITIREDRLAEMDFSDPYYVAGQIIVTLTSNSDITGPSALSGKSVGVQTGTTGDYEAQDIDGVDVVGYDEIGMAFVALMGGQIDAVICDTPVSTGYLGKYDTLKTVGEVLTTEEYGIALPKGNEDLLEKINAGLAKVIEKGVIEDLVEKWLMN